MDSEYTYQPQYIWKQTTYDGLLPVTNFTEEIKEDEVRKRGKAKETGKQLGEITHFNSQSSEGEEEEVREDEDNISDSSGGVNKKDGNGLVALAKHLTTGAYIYLEQRHKYGIIKSKKTDTQIVVKIKNGGLDQKDYEEIDIDIREEPVRVEVQVQIRVVIAEDKRFTLVLNRPANDKIKVLAEELGDLLGLSKYALTFFYKGDKVGLNERLGDRDIGNVD